MSILDNIDSQMRDGDNMLCSLYEYGVESALIDKDFLLFFNDFIDKHKLLELTYKFDVDYWKDKIYISDMSHGDHVPLLNIMIFEQQEVIIRFICWIFDELKTYNNIDINKILISTDEDVKFNFYRYKDALKSGLMMLCTTSSLNGEIIIEMINDSIFNPLLR